MSNLVVKNITKSYKKNVVLSDINIEFLTGEVTAVVGLNGVGKTTLLNLLGGQTKADLGTVTFNEEETININNLSEILLITDEMILPKTSTINLLLNIFRNNNEKYDEEYAIEKLNEFELDFDKKIGKFSKGTQELVQLILLIANNPKFVIFDEPLGAIDLIKREIIFSIIIDLSLNGTGIIISTHLIRDIQNILTQMVIIDDSKVIENISIEDINNKGYEDITKYVYEKLSTKGNIIK